MKDRINWIHLYIGCNTNKGVLVGVKQDILFIQSSKNKLVAEFDKHLIGEQIFLHLQRLKDLTQEQSKELIRKGFSIGRPNGYTFSNEAFLFLLGIHVDLFGLIRCGIAHDLNNLEESQ